MGNITLTLDDKIIKSGRDYAKKHNTSLNALVKTLLKQTVIRSSSDWLDESFQIMDKAGGDSRGRKWTREDLYDI